MANLIRLKQIESGSALQASADVGTDFSQSVINIITSEVTAVLPDGVISSSAQVVDILIPLNQHSASINQFTASLDSTYATDAEVYVSQSNINIDMGEW